MAMIQSKRVLSLVQNNGGLVWFNNEDEDSEFGGVTYLSLPEADWSAMGEPREITITIELGDTLNVGMPGTLAPAGERVQGATDFPNSRDFPVREP